MKNQIKTLSFRILALLTVAVICNRVEAQQVPLFNQYFQTESFAYASSTVFQQERYISLVYRDQFGGLIGVPRNFALGYKGTTNGKLGFTANAFGNDAGLISQVKINAGLGYKLFGEGENGLSLGAQLGFSFFGLNEDRINAESLGDALLVQLLGQNGNSLSADISATYQQNGFKLNVVAPNLINESITDDAYVQINDDNAPSIMGGISYEWIISPKLQANPYVGVRHKEVFGAQIDFMTEFIYDNKYRIYGGYREGYGATAGLGFMLTPKLLFTYQYDFGKRNVPFLANGYSEFGLHVKLKSREAIKQDRLDEGQAVVERISEENIFDINLINLEDRSKALRYLSSLQIGSKRERNIRAQEAYETLFVHAKNQQLAKYEVARLAKVDVIELRQEEAMSEKSVNETTPILSEEEKKEINKVLTLATESIAFKTASAELTEESFSALDQVAQLLLKNPGIKLELSGHTDNTGNEASNLQLSKDRASSVKTYLSVKGIASVRISAEGYGSNRPISDNSTQKGRALNRRVEMKIVEQ